MLRIFSNQLLKEFKDVFWNVLKFLLNLVTKQTIPLIRIITKTNTLLRDLFLSVKFETNRQVPTRTQVHLTFGPKALKITKFRTWVSATPAKDRLFLRTVATTILYCVYFIKISLPINNRHSLIWLFLEPCISVI